jgi:hypothetical protein
MKPSGPRKSSPADEVADEQEQREDAEPEPEKDQADVLVAAFGERVDLAQLLDAPDLLLAGESSFAMRHSVRPAEPRAAAAGGQPEAGCSADWRVASACS